MLTKKLFNILKFGLPFFALVAVTLGIYLFNISFNNPPPVYAASCTSCPSGWSSCYNGTMCCTGNPSGCPSYICLNNCPAGATCSWDAGYGQCRVCFGNACDEYPIRNSQCQSCSGGGGGGCVECKK